MRIHVRKVYSIGGIDFDTEEKARAWVYDQIGSLLDKQLSHNGIVIGPKQTLGIVDSICQVSTQMKVLLEAYKGQVER